MINIKEIEVREKHRWQTNTTQRDPRATGKALIKKLLPKVKNFDFRGVKYKGISIDLMIPSEIGVDSMLTGLRLYFVDHHGKQVARQIRINTDDQFDDEKFKEKLKEMIELYEKEQKATEKYTLDQKQRKEHLTSLAKKVAADCDYHDPDNRSRDVYLQYNNDIADDRYNLELRDLTEEEVVAIMNVINK